MSELLKHHPSQVELNANEQLRAQPGQDGSMLLLLSVFGIIAVFLGAVIGIEMAVSGVSEASTVATRVLS